MVCFICERRCHMEEGSIGECHRYECREGAIHERFSNTYLVTAPISAETMPVLHFHPRAKFLQISTTGCNFDCDGCISTVVAKEMDTDSKALHVLSPEQIVQKAQSLNCTGIAFLMNDPLASFFTFLEVCKLAKQAGLVTGCSSNGYFTLKTLDMLIPYLDFINIGLKGLSNAIYRSCHANSYKPVLRNIEYLVQKGVHVEVACIHKKGNESEVVAIAEHLATLSKSIPLQLMRFIPIDDAALEDEPSIQESEMLYQTLKSRLNYVYVFNSPGSTCLHTYCPSCGALIFERDFYGPMGSKLRRIHHFKDGQCTKCAHTLAITGAPSQNVFDEEGFEGGYPMTRALEIVEGTLVALGVDNQHDVTRCWEELLADNGLKKLHVDIQNFDDYAATILFLARIVGKEENADALIAYMRNKIDTIVDALKGVTQCPRVYYVMGKPLFALEDTRLENQLVELAGGMSLNKTLVLDGRPGRKITREELLKLNPDVIFISSFLDSPLEAFYDACREEQIDVEAIKQHRVYTHPYPCFDFGSPRWILGLMYIADMLHPEIFHFDIHHEATLFYKQFYGQTFEASMLNRSFAKPSRVHRLNRL